MSTRKIACAPGSATPAAWLHDKATQGRGPADLSWTIGPCYRSRTSGEVVTLVALASVSRKSRIRRLVLVDNHNRRREVTLRQLANAWECMP